MEDRLAGVAVGGGEEEEDAWDGQLSAIRPEVTSVGSLGEKRGLA